MLPVSFQFCNNKKKTIIILVLSDGYTAAVCEGYDQQFIGITIGSLLFNLFHMHFFFSRT